MSAATLASLHSFVRRCDYTSDNCYGAALRELVEERDRFRIEADERLREYDALELEAGVMGGALSAIANPRPNMSFDPWARDLARKALGQVPRTRGTLP